MHDYDSALAPLIGDKANHGKSSSNRGILLSSISNPDFVKSIKYDQEDAGATFYQHRIDATDTMVFPCNPHSKVCGYRHAKRSDMPPTEILDTAQYNLQCDPLF